MTQAERKLKHSAGNLKPSVRRLIPSSTGIIILAYIAFISLGMPDGLLGVAWPSIRKDFSRPIDSLGLLLFSATSGYLISSFYSGIAVTRLGVGWVLALSCMATGTSMLAYTLVPLWWLLLPLSFILGMGGGAIDTGINSYMAANHGERLMQWLHASFGIGITSGPFIMTAGISLLSSWRFGYYLVGAMQLILSAAFAITASMWERKDGKGNPDGVSGNLEKNNGSKIKETEDIKATGERGRATIRETLSKLEVWQGMVIFFIYAGVEISIGSWAYTLLTESRGVSSELAGLWVGSYWASFTFGRILAGFFTRHMKIADQIRIGIICAFAGIFLLMLNLNQALSLVGITIAGFSIAPIFPGLVSLTQKRVGERYAANTIGFQFSAGALGSAAIPALLGVMAQHTTLETIPLMITLLVLILFGLNSFASIRHTRKGPSTGVL